MSEKVNQIQRDRTRIARLYIDYCKRHYKGKWSDVVLKNKKIVRVDVTETSIELCLITFMENLSCTEFGLKEGRERVSDLYNDMLNKDGSKLTPVGATVMSEIMLSAVTESINNPINNILQAVNNEI